MTDTASALPLRGSRGTKYGYETANGENYTILKQFAVHHRRYPTEAESALWSCIQHHGLSRHFRRQHIIGDYIVDFICLQEKLIIEIDGGYHSQEAQIIFDQARTEWLNEQGFKVIRFKNEEVLFDTDKVLNKIKKEFNKQND